MFSKLKLPKGYVLKTKKKKNGEHDDPHHPLETMNIHRPTCCVKPLNGRSHNKILCVKI